MTMANLRSSGQSRGTRVQPATHLLIQLLMFSVAATSTAQLSFWDNQLWNQGVPLSEDTAEDGDEFGKSVAGGDFNGDGYDDLAIGVPRETLGYPTVSEAGVVHVFYGGPDWITVVGDQVLRQGAGGIIGQREERDRFGYSLAAGDFDDDGYDDLVVGVPYEAIGLEGHAGQVQVIYGSGSGLSTRNDAWYQDDPGVSGSSEINDKFGYAVAVGDFNDDGYDDLAIGVPGESISSDIGTGMVNVLYGGSLGLSTTGQQSWHQDTDSILGENENGDAFGMALAAGNFDGDSCDDLAIGVPFEDIGSVVDAGRVALLFGSSFMGLTSRDQSIHQDTSEIEDTAETNDFFGIALAAGDFDGDGRDDLAVGISEEDVGTTIDVGAIQVIGGSGTGLSSSDQFLTQSDLGGTNHSGDSFGASLAAGDFDGDGYDDLGIGAPTKDLNNAGVAYVAYGTGSGISGTGAQHWHQNQLNVIGVGESDELFSTSLASADFDNDGYDDLAAGIVADVVSTNAAGSVQVLYGTRLQQLSISPSGTCSGSVTSDISGIDCGADCAEYYPLNRVVTLSTSPDAHCEFEAWSGHSDCTDGTVTMSMDKSCTAEFVLSQYTLSVGPTGLGSGTVTSSPAGIDCGATCSADFDYLTSVQLTPSPAVGSTFAGWTGDADCSDGEVSMVGSMSCTAEFSSLLIFEDGFESGSTVGWSFTAGD